MKPKTSYGVRVGARPSRERLQPYKISTAPTGVKTLSHFLYQNATLQVSFVFTSRRYKTCGIGQSIHPCIFDVEHKFYKIQGVRDIVWQKISEYMNKSREYSNYKRTAIAI